jgi:hypothetical protein
MHPQYRAAKEVHFISVIDKMNRSNGLNKIKFPTLSLVRHWKMKQEKRSPSISAKIQEIITIKL